MSQLTAEAQFHSGGGVDGTPARYVPLKASAGTDPRIAPQQPLGISMAPERGYLPLIGCLPAVQAYCSGCDRRVSVLGDKAWPRFWAMNRRSGMQ
jgi:hypothetical protein